MAEEVAIRFDPPVRRGQLAEFCEGDRVERETTLRVGLRRSLHGAGGGVCDLACDVERLPMEVDVLPLQRAQGSPRLAPATAASRKKIGRLRLTACAASMRRTTSSALGKWMDGRRAGGGVARRAGLCAIQSQAMPCSSARCSTE